MAGRAPGRKMSWGLAAAIICLGSSPPAGEIVRPYFGKGFEAAQVRARNYRQRYYEGILITGTEKYLERNAEALGMIESADARSWYFVRKHIGKITQTGHSGMDVAGGRFTSGYDDAETPEWLAGKIVHDAWHRELFVRGEGWRGRKAEALCLEMQNDLLEKLNAGKVDLDAALAGEFWTVDYWSREW